MIVSGKEFFGGKPGISVNQMIQTESARQQATQPGFGEDLMGDIKGIGYDIKSTVQEKGMKQAEILESRKTGQQGALSTGFQTATNLLSAVSGVAGDVIKGGVKAVLPQETETKLKEEIGTVSQKVMELPETQEFIQNYKDLEKSHPEMARNIVSLAEGGEFLLNFLGLKGAKTIGETVLGQGKKLVQGGLEVAEELTSKAGTAVESITGKAAPILGKGRNPAEISLEAVTPSARDLTPTEYGDLVRQGKVSPKTATQPAGYVMSDIEKGTAQKYSNLLQGGDPVKNSSNVLEEIVKKDSLVEQFLDTQGTKVASPKKFREYLLSQLKDIDDIRIPADRLQVAKQNLVDNFVKNLPRTGKGYSAGTTMRDLWKARKLFDMRGDAMKIFEGSPNVQKEIARKFRNGIQDFIATNTSDGIYKGYMKDMSELYDLADVLETKAVKEKGKSAIQAWIRANPSKSKVAKIIIGTGLVGTAGGVLAN